LAKLYRKFYKTKVEEHTKEWGVNIFYKSISFLSRAIFYFTASKPIQDKPVTMQFRENLIKQKL
jgi:hypothetical protein